MKRFNYNTTTTASKNIRYRRPESSTRQLGIFCELCGAKMIMDEYGMYKCPKCDVEKNSFIADSQVY